MSHTTPSTLSPSAAAFSFSRRNQLSSGGSSTWLSMRAVFPSLGVRSTSRVRDAPSYAACVTANVTPSVVSPSTRHAARYVMPSGRGAADAAPRSSSAATSAQIRFFIVQRLLCFPVLRKTVIHTTNGRAQGLPLFSGT